MAPETDFLLLFSERHCCHVLYLLSSDVMGTWEERCNVLAMAHGCNPHFRPNEEKRRFRGHSHDQNLWQTNAVQENLLFTALEVFSTHPAAAAVSRNLYVIHGPFGEWFPLAACLFFRLGSCSPHFCPLSTSGAPNAATSKIVVEALFSFFFFSLGRTEEEWVIRVINCSCQAATAHRLTRCHCRLDFRRK